MSRDATRGANATPSAAGARGGAVRALCQVGVQIPAARTSTASSIRRRKSWQRGSPDPAWRVLSTEWRRAWNALSEPPVSAAGSPSTMPYQSRHCTRVGSVRNTASIGGAVPAAQLT